MEEIAYKIGEVAERLATSIRTIRYYEEQELVTPIRTARGTRLYSEKHVVRLMVILRLTKIGFSIDTIRNIAKIRENGFNGDETSSLVNHCLTEISGIINSQINEMKTLNNEIEDAMNIIDLCKGCSNKPSSKGCPHCPVRSNLKDIELLNLVWDTE